MDPSTAYADDRLSERVALAGLAGGILPFVLFGWMLLVGALADDSQCGHFGCVGRMIEAWESGHWVALVLAWPLLHLLRVRPAWRVALAAPLFLLPVWVLVGELVDAAIVMSGVFAYPFAALVTAPRISRWWRLVVLTLYLVLCVFLAFVPGSALTPRLV
ncbi:hypothetical protein [Nonomuraea sp. SYSU D8015]|uniref:hypothetical protein n=1 Tax=Nonomuraea sp. SYSU D8015 TaxID=2593644 RepID=UPI001660EF46|nr:hypothetical protein [Nonomuraea sp. SYSU D8015]